MASKYDQYWANHLSQIRVGVSRAGSQGVATVPLSGLRALGDRQSWHGTAEVRDHEVVTSSMAHATSLAKTVANSAICEQCSGQKIRFTINTAGNSLSIAVGVAEPRTSPERLSLEVEQAPLNQPSESRGRTADTGQFYATLTDLTRRVGGPRLLRTCTGSSGWPRQGVYFFYEDGELHPDNSRRIVRVGTHALTADGQATLWGRLRQHRGSHDGRGNHRASVFRRHVGAALIRRELPSDTWLGRDAQRAEIRESGLWNVEHVDLQYDPAFLDRLERLAHARHMP